METRMEWKKNLYGLTAGQCELPAREMERKTTMERTQNLYGLTAGQCEFYPQGNENVTCHQPARGANGIRWNEWRLFV